MIITTKMHQERTFRLWVQSWPYSWQMWSYTRGRPTF